MEFFDEICGNKPETDPVAVEVGIDIDEEPTANAASRETQEELRDDLSDDDGKYGKGRVPKKGKKVMQTVLHGFQISWLISS